VERIIKDVMGADVQKVKFDLRLARWYAVIGGLLAIVPAYWAPVHVPYLASAAVIGSVGVALNGLVVRRWRGASILVIFFVVTVAREIRPWLLPSDEFLCWVQFLGVFAFTMGALQIFLLKRSIRNIEARAA